MKKRMNDKYEIIYSAPIDKYLEVVIATDPSRLDKDAQYVCWYYNSETDSYNNGDYCGSLYDAYKAFERRAK